MEKPETNRVRDARQNFDLSGAHAAGSSLAESSKAHRLKVFKSGNSLALRLPKALGLEAGMELELTLNGGGGYTLIRVEPEKPRLDISGFWGKAKHLKVPERRDFDERPSAIAARLARGGE